MNKRLIKNTLTSTCQVNLERAALDQNGRGPGSIQYKCQFSILNSIEVYEGLVPGAKENPSLCSLI